MEEERDGDGEGDVKKEGSAPEIGTDERGVEAVETDAEAVADALRSEANASSR